GWHSVDKIYETYRIRLVGPRPPEVSKGNAQVRIIAYCFVKAGATETPRFSIYENTAVEQDWNFEAGCCFINIPCAVVIRIPSGWHHFESMKSQLMRADKIFACTL